MANVIHSKNSLSIQLKQQIVKQIFFLLGFPVLIFIGLILLKVLFGNQTLFLFGVFAGIFIWGILNAKQYTKIKIIYAGLQGEKNTNRLLGSLPESYAVLSDITIEVEGKRSQIDHIVVGPTGVYVIETKNLNGSIVGSESDHQLVQHKIGRRGGEYSKSFYNPVKQVGTHVYRLATYLKKYSLDTWVQGIVYFSNPDAEVNVNSEKIPVFCFEEGPNQIIRYVMDQEAETLSVEKTKRIVDLLSKLTL
ncbi:NERD domain-containing protein [Brevibacillus ruminantium]|uniref:NERD domain-containing protein n=1 Tax=Brevibacillus ruminantium TaxID=2950604 RepID=A0ABY4WKD2_9BACL|nr:nuclease-related domain-containing protein [Brevibacillus ruminantium]USG65111.1 NERD domain-containing protein [Brevibacillus ruminantium]